MKTGLNWLFYNWLIDWQYAMLKTYLTISTKHNVVHLVAISTFSTVKCENTAGCCHMAIPLKHKYFHADVQCREGAGTYTQPYRPYFITFLSQWCEFWPHSHQTNRRDPSASADLFSKFHDDYFPISTLTNKVTNAGDKNMYLDAITGESTQCHVQHS